MPCLAVLYSTFNVRSRDKATTPRPSCNLPRLAASELRIIARLLSKASGLFKIFQSQPVPIICSLPFCLTLASADKTSVQSLFGVQLASCGSLVSCTMLAAVPRIMPYARIVHFQISRTIHYLYERLSLPINTSPLCPVWTAHPDRPAFAFIVLPRDFP